jgi:hypothetical protein
MDAVATRTEVHPAADAPSSPRVQRRFLLQRVQPALSGLIDGSLSSLAPIFAVALSTRSPHYAFIAGLATAIGAGISMAFSEALSDTGNVTERGSAWQRGGVIGLGTFTGSIVVTRAAPVSRSNSPGRDTTPFRDGGSRARFGGLGSCHRAPSSHRPDRGGPVAHTASPAKAPGVISPTSVAIRGRRRARGASACRG